MPALRASYTIEPRVLLKFNELVPQGERSQLIQSLMERVLLEKQRQLSAVAEEFETHPDFTDARAVASEFEIATSADGLDE